MGGGILPPPRKVYIIFILEALATVFTVASRLPRPIFSLPCARGGGFCVAKLGGVVNQIASNNSFGFNTD